VAPTTGERCFLELPHLNADLFPSFIDALAQAFADGLNNLLLDHSARIPHKAVGGWGMSGTCGDRLTVQN
jgi:hypothetical protein